MSAQARFCVMTSSNARILLIAGLSVVLLLLLTLGFGCLVWHWEPTFQVTGFSWK
jgi:hypothetical protein